MRVRALVLMVICAIAVVTEGSGHFGEFGLRYASGDAGVPRVSSANTVTRAEPVMDGMPLRPGSAEAVGRRLVGGVPDAIMAVRPTVGTDPDHLLGRPDGYVAVVIVVDRRASCTRVTADCGVQVEEWPTPAAARARAAFRPFLTPEYHYLAGRVLVRVSGTLALSAAYEYELAVDSH